MQSHYELTEADLAFVEAAVDFPEVLEVPDPGIGSLNVLVLYCGGEEELRDVLADVNADPDSKIARISLEQHGAYRVVVTENKEAK